MSARARVLSGIQPSGEGKHLGNYLGAVRQWAAMQDEFECFYFVADLHALTTTPDREVLRGQIRRVVAELLAMGVDPERSALFAQSHLPEHAELAWVLSCLTGFGEASRMTQFKEKGGGSSHSSVGLFNYPILQAGDILLYQPQAVPVGEDQRQHLELTRDLAQRFNHRYGETFTVPSAHTITSVARIKDLADPTAKMSTSRGGSGTLWVIEDDKATVKKIKSAVTDTGREVEFDEDTKPGISNLLTILSAATGKQISELQDAYAGKGYGDFKTDVAEAVVELYAPIRTRFAEFSGDPAYLDEVLAAGRAKARVVAEATMAAVRERVGLLAAR